MPPGLAGPFERSCRPASRERRGSPGRSRPRSFRARVGPDASPSSERPSEASIGACTSKARARRPSRTSSPSQDSNSSSRATASAVRSRASRTTAFTKSAMSRCSSIWASRSKASSEMGSSGFGLQSQAERGPLGFFQVGFHRQTRAGTALGPAGGGTPPGRAFLDAWPSGPSGPGRTHGPAERRGRTERSPLLQIREILSGLRGVKHGPEPDKRAFGRSRTCAGLGGKP